MQAIWTVERTAHRRFPYRIAIEQNGRLLLAVRAQAAWPGPGQQVFCLRDRKSTRLNSSHIQKSRMPSSA